MNRFTLGDGRTFGPFPLGAGKFVPREYPLRQPHFEHTYALGEVRPDNFENFAYGNGFWVRNGLFRPDPEVLAAIKNRVHGPLAYHNWKPELVKTGKGTVREGESLFPPVKPTGKLVELDVPDQVRANMQHQTLSRLIEHRMDSPLFWHLTVPNRKGPERHIMMTKANAADLVQGGGQSGNRDFWLFQEGVIGKWDGQKMALLGGMYLPKEAENHLKEAG